MTDQARWDALRKKLTDRLAMSREVLDREGYDDVAALVPLEEVIIWMDELTSEPCRVIIGEQNGVAVECGAIESIHGSKLGQVSHTFNPNNPTTES